MKKIILPLIALFMISIAIAQPPSPMPIKGFLTFNGVSVKGQEVIVTNTGSGEILTSSDVPSLKTENGVFFFDMSQFKQGVAWKSRAYPGDQIEINVCPFDDQKCKYTFYADSSIPIREIKIEIITSQIQPPIQPPTQPPAQEPVVIPPTTQPTLFKCADGTEVQDTTECPLTKPNINNIATGVGVALGAGIVGLIAYYWRKGKKSQAKKMLDTSIKNKKK